MNSRIQALSADAQNRIARKTAKLMLRAMLMDDIKLTGDKRLDTVALRNQLANELEKIRCTDEKDILDDMSDMTETMAETKEDLSSFINVMLEELLVDLDSEIARLPRPAAEPAPAVSAPTGGGANDGQ